MLYSSERIALRESDSPDGTKAWKRTRSPFSKGQEDSGGKGWEGEVDGPMRFFYNFFLGRSRQ